jgi:hypothetical protein
MGHLLDTTEIAGRDQKILEKRIERIEKHLGLPPLKAVCEDAAAQQGERPHPPTISKRPAKLRYLRKLRQQRLPRRI